MTITGGGGYVRESDYIDWISLAFDRKSDLGRRRSFRPNGPLPSACSDHLPCIDMHASVYIHMHKCRRANI